MAAFNFGGFGGDGGGLGALGMGLPRGFEEQYHCYPVSFQVRRASTASKASNQQFFFSVDDVFGTSVGDTGRNGSVD